MSNTTSPPDRDLRSALVDIKKANPTLGIPKIHALLLQHHPEWTVSEKRTRKILQAEGLIANGSAKSLIPVSRLMPSSAITILPPSVSVHNFGPPKGKGLLAKKSLTSGESLWQEDPWILAPEWDLYDLQQQGAACTHCSTPFRRPGMPCDDCAQLFCNRLCLNRARDTGHRVLCTQKGRKLVALAKEMDWMALHALAKATARIVQTREIEVYDAFAVLGLEERYRFIGSEVGDTKNLWRKAFDAYTDAFKGKNIGELGTFEGFLKGLGRMSLNLEAHGGLYTLHSHLNHSCDPNISVRHLQPKESTAKITVLTRRDIAEGEELTISYVNPELSYAARQRELGEWGFVCKCSRCEKDVREGAPGLSDMETELRAGLGVF